MSLFLYIILLISAALFYPLYENDLSFAVLAALLILPLLLAVELAVTVRSLKVSVQNQIGHVSKGKYGEIRIDIANSSPFAIPDIRLKLHTRMYPGGIDDRISLNARVGADSVSHLPIAADTSHLGVLSAYIDYVEIRDILGLFSWKIRSFSGFIGSLSVIPDIDEKYEEQARRLLLSARTDTDDDGEKVITTGPGEVIDFRDYRSGDRTVHIHHKLSARFDKDIVKVMGTDADRPFLLIPIKSDETDPDKRDRIIERTMNIAYFLRNTPQGSFVCVSGGSGGYEELKITDENSFTEAAIRSVSSPFPEVFPEKGFVCCMIGADEEADHVAR